jgi:hypothetical protein
MTSIFNQPKVSIDFQSAVLDPRISFTRSLATATRTNSVGLVEQVAADTARFDYDPITLTCRGLLIEELRENSLPYSEQFDNAVWTKQRSSIVQNVEIAPDGTLTGDNLIENTDNNTHFVFDGVLTANSTTYTWSIFLKAKERTKAAVIFNTKSQVLTGRVFDLLNGTSSAPPSGFTSATTHDMKPVGNGWYRCSVTVNSATGAGIFHCRVYTADASGNLSYTGDGSSGIYIWGAQRETGAFPTSYIPTTITALTRNADVATITGTNFSDFWQANKGGVQVQAIPSTVSGIRPLVQYDDGTANEIIALRGNTTNPELYIVDGGTPQAQLDAGTIAANTAYSLTGWWATNDCKARKDSGAVVIDTMATIPTVTQARLGSDGTNYLNGHLATIDYYDQFSGQIYTRRKNKVIFNVI